MIKHYAVVCNDALFCFIEDDEPQKQLTGAKSLAERRCDELRLRHPAHTYDLCEIAYTKLVYPGADWNGGM